MATREQAIEVLKKCEDPELHIDVWTLGLIYDLQIRANDSIYIKMTLTTPFCPYGDALMGEIQEKLMKLDGIKGVEIELTFEPPWKPSDELKDMLGVN